jgi:hypothetical protein
MKNIVRAGHIKQHYDYTYKDFACNKVLFVQSLTEYFG